MANTSPQLNARHSHWLLEHMGFWERTFKQDRQSSLSWTLGLLVSWVFSYIALHGREWQMAGIAWVLGPAWFKAKPQRQGPTLGCVP